MSKTERDKARAGESQLYGERLFVVLAIVELRGPLTIQSLHAEVRKTRHQVTLRTIRRDINLLANANRVTYDPEENIIAAKNRETIVQFLKRIEDGVTRGVTTV